MIFWASISLIGISVFIVAHSFLKQEEEFKASEQLEDKEKGKKAKDLGIVLKLSRPAFKRYVTPIVLNMKGKKKIREKYKRLIASAGLTQDMAPEEFFAFKLFLILGFPIVFLAVRAFLEETWPLALVVPMGAFGYYYPGIWAKKKIQMRQKEMVMNMPFVVDMLALSVEAGLDFLAAMNKVIDKAPQSALVEEFRIILKDIKMGASRAEALRGFGWRADLMVISSFCATLIAADSVGANIGPILKNLSSDIRQKRSAEAEKAGAKAATKILFPMFGFIVPAVFIIIASPIVLEMIIGK